MLLVHVAGTADLGIPLIVGGRSRPRQETAELTARRAAELDAARTGGRRSAAQRWGTTGPGIAPS